MSNYDKYDPMAGGFRAKLAANWGYTSNAPDPKHADLRKLFAVGLNTSGLVGKFGTAFPTFAGVLVLTTPKAAGDVVDIMTSGEILDVDDAEVTGTNGPGVRLYSTAPATTTGVPTVTSAAGGFLIGFFVETNRLVVRVDHSVLAA